MNLKQLNSVLKPLRKPWTMQDELDIADQEWFEEDILVISCFSYRNGWGYISKLSYNRAESCDYILASEIRNHFRSKLTMTILQGKTLSNFRQDVANFLEKDYSYTKGLTEGFLYPTKILGLVTKLPYFYEYDKNLKEVFEGSYSIIQGDYGKFTHHEKVKFKKRLVVNTRTQQAHEYWFETSQNDMLMIPIKSDNPLDHLFNRVINSGELEIAGTFFLKKRDSLEYLTVEHWHVVE